MEDPRLPDSCHATRHRSHPDPALSVPALAAPLSRNRSTRRSSIIRPSAPMLLVTIILRRRRITQLQAVQGAGTGQGVTAVTFARALLRRSTSALQPLSQRQSAVVTQSVMVIEIAHNLRRQAQHPLCDQASGGDARPDLDRDGRQNRPPVCRSRQTTGPSFTQQQHTAVRCQSTAVKRAYDRASSETVEPTVVL